MGEVVSVALVHHFHAEAGTVQHISPGVQDAALTIKDGLVEVEAVQVEGHGRHAEGGEPDADNRPGSQEEVKATAVVEGGVLEDQATEVTVGSHDVVGLFLLAKLVAVVRDSLSVVSRTREEVTREPCMAENKLPPKTPATPSMWKGCIRMLCSAWNTNM